MPNWCPISLVKGSAVFVYRVTSPLFVLRADVWNADKHVAEGTLPTPREILEHLTQSEIEAKHYDTEWPERAKGTMW